MSAQTDPKVILRQNAGARMSQRCRQTGTTITLYRTAECGLGDVDDGVWSTVCENHGSIVQHDTRRNAESAMAYPDWCDDCRDIINSKERSK